MILQEEFDGLVITFEDTVQELERLERLIATQHCIVEPVRDNIIKGINDYSLPEDELISRWECVYATYREWLKNS